ncbi:hypothetical protein RJ639_039727 [Escallonia herrerae]|uniref:Glycoside hydrolase family 19 catalytic domain-containing protein n=1 Tax=Escallonia herrerae TaxID=1293975 RepID=A0AA88WKD1_9ASTE|nr:hypothetical protein RJ639_039727 [Escallonia herrerae]
MRFWAVTFFCFCSTLLLGLGALAQRDVGSLLSESQFNQMLKHRNDANCPAKGFYTYQAFISAAKSFRGFGTTGDIDTRKREIAAFLAQTSRETTGNFSTLDSLGCIKYLNVDMQMHRTVHTHGDIASNRKRATHQITVFQINSGPVLPVKNNMAEVLSKLRSKPCLEQSHHFFQDCVMVLDDSTITQTSSHDVITGRWRPTSTDSAASRAQGYGFVTNIINGGIECGKGPNAQVADRIGFYKRYCDMLKVGYGNNLDCYNQKPFA